MITPLLKYFTLKRDIFTEVLAVGMHSFIMTLMSTLSNLSLNNIIAGYTNEVIAGMGIAKKIDLLAFAIAQEMTRGTLPLIGYNYSSGSRKRMISVIKFLTISCFAIAFLGMGLMFFGAKPIIRCFINNALTVEHGQLFLRILCVACPTTAINFIAITIFQATGKKIQPLILSLLRKGGLDIPLMLLNNTSGIDGIAWVTPLTDVLAMMISIVLILLY